MNRYSLLACSLHFLCFQLLSLAQGDPAAGPVMSMVLPPGASAWTVQIFTTGGFTGRGVGDFAVSSSGEVRCSLPQGCPKEFVSSALRPMIEALPLTIPFPAGPVVLPGCADCILRTIIIRNRDTLGAQHVWTYTWNDLSRSKMPREMMQIHDAVIAARK